MIKTFYFFCFVVSRSIDVPGVDVSLFDVYGPVSEVSKLLPWSQRKSTLLNGVELRDKSRDDTILGGYSSPSPLREDAATIPYMPKAPIPESPKVKIPPVPFPEIPTVPFPKFPTLPTLPTFPPITLPTIPIPKIPTFPTVTFPGFPTPHKFTLPPLPTLPSLPTFSFPAISTIPLPTRTEHSLRTLPEDITCTQEIEILFVQDVSYGNTEIISEVGLSFMSELDLALKAKFSAARFGLVSFSDLYLITNPESTDYCAQPIMTKFGKHSSVMKLFQGLRTADHLALFANQLGALSAGLDTSVVQWSKNDNVIRLALVLTNTVPHFALDGYNVLGLPEFDETKAAANLTGSCAQQYYPSPAQVRDAVYNSEVYVGFLVLSSLLDPYVSKNYVWMSNYLNQTNDFVQLVQPKARDILAKVEAILSSVIEVECHGTTTTLPATDTYVPSTQGTAETREATTTTRRTTTTPPTTTTTTTTTTPPTTTTTTTPPTTTTTPPTTTTTPLTTTTTTTTLTTTTPSTTTTTTTTPSSTTTTTTRPSSTRARITEGSTRAETSTRITTEEKTIGTTKTTTMPTTVQTRRTVSSTTLRSTETSTFSGDATLLTGAASKKCSGKRHCSTRCDSESGCCEDEVIIKMKELPKRFQVVMDN